MLPDWLALAILAAAAILGAISMGVIVEEFARGSIQLLRRLRA